MTKTQKRLKKGTTLIEILIAVLVFSIALGALLNSLGAIVSLIDASRDKTLAVATLKNIMERVRATPFSALKFNFPNGTIDGPGSNPYANIVGNYMLVNQGMVVTYTDPLADPLEIRVTTFWDNKNGRTFNTSISTFRTK